ncbi:MAG: nitrogen fixation protein FixH [Paracoccaceae bacterium]|jgi:nitrogen fixation protein FixH
MSPDKPGRPLTGRKVLMIALAFFGVVFAVNIYMMTQAIGGFPGLVEKHPYRASQRFDRERNAQIAQGWRVGLEWRDARLEAALTDRGGAPLRGLIVTADVGRPTTRQGERLVTLIPIPDRPGVYAADLALAPGRWRAEMVAVDGTGATHRAGAEIWVKE